ncbi:MAG: hypothetical protein QN213_04980 [Armatimonadota bacterium]|nr:hypothetical protein [Armatimonadota bacterium]MDR5675224.1 hypothetical protein [Armatimonadota bacterium]MDR5688599.1 hypothetical protein [Armatimonadota bacterium]MDR7389847.1 hypothetical protein [Armatimonadota bacterium]MDR7391048.1 hypothetical protein [Armatimonadota bacterium]
MPTLEERVAYLEGKVEELSGGYGQLRQDVHGLDQKVDRFREELSSRIDNLDHKVDRFREELSSRIDNLDQKFSRWFAWHTGILVTALLGMLGVLGAALLR